MLQCAVKRYTVYLSFIDQSPEGGKDPLCKHLRIQKRFLADTGGNLTVNRSIVLYQLHLKMTIS